MIKFYSNVTQELLHIIFRKEDFVNRRIDISSNEEFLQVAAMSLEDGKTFKPHRHIPLSRETTITQESWIVIDGIIESTYYDLDDSFLGQMTLNSGDCTITFRGGHNYKSLRDNSLVYEVKTGPYFGNAVDKVEIK